MRLYIAGPMTGFRDFNRPMFNAAEAMLTERGYDVLNPARSEDREECTFWSDYMRPALRDISTADGLALLPGWASSKGAQLEAFIASQLDIWVRPLVDWMEEIDDVPHRPAHYAPPVPTVRAVDDRIIAAADGLVEAMMRVEFRNMVKHFTDCPQATEEGAVCTCPLEQVWSAWEKYAALRYTRGDQ